MYEWRRELTKFARLIAIGVVVTVLCVGAVSRVTASPAIDISVSAAKAITLTPGIISTAVDTITVTCDTTTWKVTAADADATTSGKMTAYATGAAAYDPTPAKLASAMSVKATTATGAIGAEVTLPAGGDILTGSAVVDAQAYTLTFSQPVSYLDVTLTGDGETNEAPNTYRIVVTFTGSSP